LHAFFARLGKLTFEILNIFLPSGTVAALVVSEARCTFGVLTFRLKIPSVRRLGPEFTRKELAVLPKVGRVV
jgi:hypothetical protein